MSALVADPEQYFRQFIPPRDRLLRTLEKEAQREKIPIVGPVVGELLHVLVRVARAERVLELGTATGYSAIHLARALISAPARLVTVEADAQMAARAAANLRSAGLEQVAEVVVGDALEALTAMDTVFDMVFLDIDKEAYAAALPQCRRLLRPNGLLVVDNVAFHDAEPFNRQLWESPQWRPVNLLAFLPLHSPEKDGLTLALRL